MSVACQRVVDAQGQSKLEAPCASVLTTSIKNVAETISMPLFDVDAQIDHFQGFLVKMCWRAKKVAESIWIPLSGGCPGPLPPPPICTPLDCMHILIFFLPVILIM